MTTITFDVAGLPVTQGSIIPPLQRQARQLPMEEGNDVTRGIERLRRVIGPGVDPDHLFSFVVEGDPVSKSRARYSRKSGRTYTPAKTVAAQAVVEMYFRQALQGQTLAGSVAIVAIFYRSNFQRIDADNLMKLVMDAGTKAGVWEDDCYVTAQAAFMEMDRGRPRTVIALCQTQSSLDRMRMFSCAICSKDFRRSGTATFKRPPQFCSRECRAESYRRDRQPARCPRCETEFERRSAGQRYCSPECRTAVPRVRAPREEQRPRPTCQKCGGPVSRREYIQCANCRPKGRKPGSKNQPVVVQW